MSGDVHVLQGYFTAASCAMRHMLDQIETDALAMVRRTIAEGGSLRLETTFMGAECAPGLELVLVAGDGSRVRVAYVEFTGRQLQ